MLVRAPHVLLLARTAGGADGVSVEIAKWLPALREAGLDVRVAAAGGRPDVLIDQLGPTPTAESLPRWRAALGWADLVIVHNIFTLPLPFPHRDQLADDLRRHPVLVHHHDIPWDRPIEIPPQIPVDRPGWRHVINSVRGQREFARHGIDADLVVNPFPPYPPLGDRDLTRRALGVGPADLLALHPTRAIARKNVPAAIELATALGAIYCLAGPAQDGYNADLAALLRAARTPVRHANGRLAMPDLYAAADLVVYPSLLEGFGNPVVESALYGKHLIGADYPIAGEFRARGLQWFGIDQLDELRASLSGGNDDMLRSNRAIAVAEYGIDAVLPYLLDIIDDLLPQSVPNQRRLPQPALPPSA